MTDQIQKDKSNSQGLLFVDRLMDSLDMVLSQFTSGRWILTVAAAFILVHACWSDLKNALEFKEIIAVIIYAYFQKGDNNKPNDRKGDSNVQPIQSDLAVSSKPGEIKSNTGL